MSGAVEEAICYGWIDSRVKRYGESKLLIRFTPRRSPDNWSKYNRARAAKLVKEDKMTRAGMAVLPLYLRRAEKTKSITDLGSAQYGYDSRKFVDANDD